MTWTARHWVVLLIVIGAGAAAVMLSWDGGAAGHPSKPQAAGWAGRYVVDVAHTVAEAEKVAGGRVTEAWVSDLSERTYWLELKTDDTFTLHMGEGPLELTISGTWVEGKGEIGITPTAISGQAVPPAQRATDTVRRKGQHVVINQGAHGLYFQRAE